MSKANRIIEKYRVTCWKFSNTQAFIDFIWFTKKLLFLVIFGLLVEYFVLSITQLLLFKAIILFNREYHSKMWKKNVHGGFMADKLIITNFWSNLKNNSVFISYKIRTHKKFYGRLLGYLKYSIISTLRHVIVYYFNNLIAIYYFYKYCYNILLTLPVSKTHLGKINFAFFSDWEFLLVIMISENLTTCVILFPETLKFQRHRLLTLKRKLFLLLSVKDFFSLFFFFLSTWDLNSQPGIKPMPAPAVEAQCLNHCTTREVSKKFLSLLLRLSKLPRLTFKSLAFSLTETFKNFRTAAFIIAVVLKILFLHGVKSEKETGWLLSKVA